MTNKNDNALDDTTTSETSNASHSENKSSNATEYAQSGITRSNTKQSKSALSSAALIVGMSALALSGWQLYQSELIKNSDDALSQAQNKIIALEQQIARLDRTTNANTTVVKGLAGFGQTLQNIAQSTEQQFQTTDESIIKLSQKINQLGNIDKNDWLLAEAEYLIRLANQRLLLEKDTQSAITLLSNADNILADLEDPLMFETRKAIAQDVQALKSVSSFDLEGRYLQLAALFDQVPDLPQREPSHAWQAQKNDRIEVESTSAFKTVMLEAWEGIKSLVVINYNQKPIKALLPPAEYQELITGIQLQIDVAQVALLKGEREIYDSALARVASAISEHFDASAQSTIAFMTTLTSLQQVNPNPSIPIPRASLQAMKTLMIQWNANTTPTYSPAEEEPPTPEAQTSPDTTSTDNQEDTPS